MIEVKTVGRSFTLKASDVQSLWLHSVRAGKRARFVLYFDSLDLTVDCEVVPGYGEQQ